MAAIPDEPSHVAAGKIHASAQHQVHQLLHFD